jgi:outer membrane protein OmpA-like peptidoglycan-associated protein
MPWSRRRLLWLTPLIAIPFLALALWWGVDHVEGDIETASRQVLEDTGVDTSLLTFYANYRDVEVRGTMPAGVSAAELEQLLEQAEGREENEDIRRATVTTKAAAPEALGAIALDARSDGETLTLTGSVPSQEWKDEVLAAAATTGLRVADDLTVSGLEPLSSDGAAQIQKFSSIVGGLLIGSFDSAELIVSDEGPVSGSISATDADSAAVLDAVAGDVVEVLAPPVFGSLDTAATYDGTRIVLNGTVLSTEHVSALTDAATAVVGGDNVIANLTVVDLDEAVPGSEKRIDAMASVISTFGGLASADATMNDTDLTVNGVALDSVGQTATTNAVAATSVANLRPGGEIAIADPPEPELTIQQEIDLLQAELDSLQDEIRETVVFGSDSNTLSDPATATLDKVIEAMNRYPGPAVETGGHTDSAGADEYNLDLSQRRADEVVAYIESGGIEAGRLRSVGFGETQPLADNATDEGRLQNRRVEFTAKEGF